MKSASISSSTDYDQGTVYGAECGLQCIGNNVGIVGISKSLCQMGPVANSGRGFGFLDQSLMIEATLNGHVLGTHVMPPALEFIISVELMWEVEKKALRRFRTGNVPVKLESFTIINEQKHERIGYLLLSLRAAQIAVPGRSFQISGTWHQLLGVKAEFKDHHPEVLLTVHIADARTSVEPVDITRNGTNGTNVFCHTRHLFAPQLFEDEGIIQLGPRDTANDIFMLTIFVGESVNLFLLTDAVQSPIGGFWFSCNIMGFTMHAGTLTDRNAFTANNNEKVIVRIRSTLKILRTFFTDVSVITIHLMQGKQEIAFVDVDINVLVPTNDLTTFCSHHAVNNTMAHINRCYLVKSSTGEIPEAGNGSKPYIDVVMKLKYLNENSDKMAQGDVLMYGHSPKTSAVTNQAHIQTKKNTKNDQEICFKNSDHLEQIEQRNVRHCFSLDIIVESILFHKLPPEKNIIFRFIKKKGTFIPTSHSEINVEQTDTAIHLDGITCNMKWEGLLDELHHSIMGEPPLIWLYFMADGKVLPFACGILDMELLLVRKQKDCRCTIAFRNPASDMSYGVLIVSMILHDSISLPSKEEKSSSPEQDPALGGLDSQIAFKIVEELEEWKHHQEELFKLHLKKVETAHIESLTEVWKKRQKEAELELKAKMEDCNRLAASLSKTTEELRGKSDDITHKEIELKTLEMTLQQEYILKVQDLREASRRMDDDCRNKVSQLEMENNTFRERGEVLEKQNKFLRFTVKNKEQNLEKLQKGTLTLEQTASLLQELKSLEEKHESALHSKNFFKVQWACAVREIHRIKSDYQQTLQSQLMQNREELRNLGSQHKLKEENERMFMNFGVVHQTDTHTSEPPYLRFDDNYYDETEDINEVVPKTNLSDFTFEGGMPSPSLQGSLGSVTNLKSSMAQSDEVDSKLEKLVEERDILLNTGCYSLDDEAIAKLNQEIRQFLI